MSSLQYTSYDESAWRRVMASFTGIGQGIGIARVRGVPEPESLARDLFWCFYQMESRVTNEADIHAPMIAALLASAAYANLREKVGDDGIRSVYAGMLLLQYAGPMGELDVARVVPLVEQHFIQIDESLKAFALTRQPVSFVDQMKLADTVRTNPKLGRIAKLAGRLKRMAMQIHATRTPAVRDEARDIELGDNLPNVLPVELAALAVPAMVGQFGKSYVEKRLAQRKLDGQQQDGQGPIIIALDSSASMTHRLDGATTREDWSKAIALAILEIGQVEKRDVAVMHFGYGELKTWHFPAGKASPVAMAECAEFFYGSGGTSFTPWMREALALIDSAKYDKADVIVLSDGMVYVDERMNDAWSKRRAERGMKCFGIQIGAEDAGRGGLQFVCDRVFGLSSMNDESEIASSIFAI